MKNLDDKYILGVYAKPDVQFVEGKGTWLTDENGRRYLDFVSGIAVSALGHGHPGVKAAIAAQSEKFLHISNLYVNNAQVELAQKLVEATGFDKVFFCNSGTEANEAMLKFARKFWTTQGQPDKVEVITFANSFHGRTYGGLSLTGQPALQEGFGDMLNKITVLPWNDVEALKAAITPNTAAIMLEPLQAEGGINLPSAEFIQTINSIRAEQDVLVLSDDVQCGLGRLGYFLGQEAVGLETDLVSLAKPIGGGLPLGAVLVSAPIAAQMKPGMHGSTFGGNPVSCAVGQVIVDAVLEDGFFEQVQKKSALLKAGLDSLAAKYDFLGEPRGMGLIMGVPVEGDLPKLMGTLRDQGLLVVRAGANLLRLLPPLTVSEAEIQQAMEILDQVLADF